MSDDVVTGQICDICGKSADSIYECYIKKKLRVGYFEMVKAHLCAFHFTEQMEKDIVCPDEPEIPPPLDDWEKFLHPEDEEDEDENEDNGDENGWNKFRRMRHLVDRIGQSFG